MMGGVSSLASGGGAGAQIQQEIAQSIEGMSGSQLYEIMVQMKGLAQKKPEQARQLLLNNPQFAFAMVQALTLNGTLTPQAAQQLQNVPQVFQQGPAVTAAMTMMPNVSGANIGATMSTAGFPSSGFNPTGTMASHMPSMHMVTGTTSQTTASLAQSQLGLLQDEQKQLLEQVMNLTPEQIERLSPQEQQQIKQLRQTMMSLNYGRR